MVQQNLPKQSSPYSSLSSSPLPSSLSFSLSSGRCWRRFRMVLQWLGEMSVMPVCTGGSSLSSKKWSGYDIGRLIMIILLLLFLLLIIIIIIMITITITAVPRYDLGRLITSLSSPTPITASSPAQSCPQVKKRPTNKNIKKTKRLTSQEKQNKKKKIIYDRLDW